MATSGSVDFTLARDEIIASAYELVGVGIEGEALGAEDVAVASRALNVMIKAMSPQGLHLWKRDKLTLPLTAAQSVYTIGRSGTPDLTADRPMRVLEATRVGNGTVDTNRSGMTRMTRNEYESLSNHATAATPTQFFFDPVLDNANLYLWPVPTATDATNTGIELVVQSPFEDMDASTDNVDFPAEWLEVIIYQLAVRLAPRTGLDLQERVLLKQEADSFLETVLEFDVEEESLYLQPNSEGDAWQ